MEEPFLPVPNPFTSSIAITRTIRFLHTSVKYLLRILFFFHYFHIYYSILFFAYLSKSRVKRARYDRAANPGNSIIYISLFSYIIVLKPFTGFKTEIKRWIAILIVLFEGSHILGLVLLLIGVALIVVEMILPGFGAPGIVEVFCACWASSYLRVRYCRRCCSCCSP